MNTQPSRNKRACSSLSLFFEMQRANYDYPETFAKKFGLPVWINTGQPKGSFYEELEDVFEDFRK
jgi:hypothetical protein